MTEMPDDHANDLSYAVSLANSSYDWYRSHAVRSRKTYRSVEVAILAVSVAIPVAASISPHNVLAPAILGAVTVILSGCRSIFHWQENYLRFSRAREEVERQRRLYHTGASPYQDPVTREQLLAQAVSMIEEGEMSGWIRVVSQRPRS